MSYAIDIISIAGLGLVGLGAYLWRPCFALIFAGAVLLWVGRVLAGVEKAQERK